MPGKSRGPRSAAGRTVYVSHQPKGKPPVNLKKVKPEQDKSQRHHRQNKSKPLLIVPFRRLPRKKDDVLAPWMVAALAITVLALLATALAVYVNGWLAGAVAVISLWQLYVRYLQKEWPIGVGRPEPSQGWRRAATKLLRLLRIRYTPKQSMAELIFIEEVRHRELATDRDVEFVCIGPTGGVGKGTVATNMAAISAEVTHAPTLVSDSRNKRGNVAERFGLRRKLDSENPTAVVPRATITIRQAITACELGLFDKAVWAYRIIRQFPGSYLSVIASDVSTPGTIRPDMDVTRFQRMMDRMAQVFRLIFHEADNDRGLPLDLELMRRCGVPVLVTQVRKYAAHSELLDALNYYRADGELREKLARSGVLMVLATGKKDSVKVYAEKFGLRPDQIFLVPVDPYFQQVESDVNLTLQNKPQPPIIDTKKMKRRSYLQYLRAMNQGMSTVAIKHIPFKPQAVHQSDEAAPPALPAAPSLPAEQPDTPQQVAPMASSSGYVFPPSPFAPPH